MRKRKTIFLTYIFPLAVLCIILCVSMSEDIAREYTRNKVQNLPKRKKFSIVNTMTCLLTYINKLHVIFQANIFQISQDDWIKVNYLSSSSIYPFMCIFSG